jgi:hypothetical protein
MISDLLHSNEAEVGVAYKNAGCSAFSLSQGGKLSHLCFAWYNK